ncbi:hypothetical protein QQ045_006275 [Rhodiola kirilowii]
MAETFLDSVSNLMEVCMAGRERRKEVEALVSIMASSGRSWMVTGGRRTTRMAPGRVWRMELNLMWLKGMRKRVKVRLWEWRSWVASWTSGIKWPRPGVGTKAMCGLFAVSGGGAAMRLSLVLGEAVETLVQIYMSAVCRWRWRCKRAS